MPMLTHSDRSGKHHAFDMQRDAHVRVLSTLCHLVNAADVLWLHLRTPHDRLLKTPVQVAESPPSCVQADQPESSANRQRGKPRRLPPVPTWSESENTHNRAQAHALASRTPVIHGQQVRVTYVGMCCIKPFMRGGTLCTRVGSALDLLIPLWAPS
jgi:hypothetical protein